MASSKPSTELLDSLWKSQKADHSLSATTLNEAKFILRDSSLCICIEVTTPKPRTNIVDATPFNLEDHAIPAFIKCQLINQKLIDSHNFQDTIALPAVLSALTQLYATNSIKRADVFPTVFRWHCSRTHRTHILFAYTDIKMQSKVYSVDELLNLKNTVSPNLAAAVAVRDNDLCEMLRAKSRVSSRSYNANSVRRANKRTTDECSTTSDEVVFKGTNRRASKTEAQTQQPPTQTGQRDHVTQGPQLSATASTSGADQPTEWRYRGRTGSELMISEPLSAPTGLKAQQSEGFQRFYKAVVSPTHVRVTAGGRIVPNTRNPVSPTTKRPREGDVIANDAQSSEPVQMVGTAAAAAATAKQPMPAIGMPQPMQFFYPGFHPSMSAFHPVTGMPIPVMPPSYSMPMPNPSTAASATAVMQEAPFKENQFNHNNDGKTAAAAVVADAGRAGIRMSPNDQFDQSRPFMYNSQPWMYPIFPPTFPGFVGMSPVPPPGFAGPPFPGAPMIIPSQMAVAPMMGAPGPMGPPTPLSATFPPTAAAAASAPAAAPAPAPTPAPALNLVARQSTMQLSPKPPISSIRPSNVTRKQIDALRVHLRYLEDQLQYNKHQIDEKHMAEKIQQLKGDIERFEVAYKSQADFEERNYPKIEKTKEDVSSSDSRRSLPSTKTSQSQSEESKESKATTATMTSQPRMSKKERARTMVGINSTKSCNASYEYEDTGERFIHGPSKRSKLPSGAALAPVFQPRSVSAFTAPAASTQSQKAWQFCNPSEEITQERLKEMEESLVAAGSKALKLSQHVQELSVEASSQERRVHGHESLGLPYLVGTLPHGANPYASHRVEYEYSRRLTDEELEARQSYWGKESRPDAQGLPKYDGKNFYPPSPLKVSGSRDASHFQRGQETTSETENGKYSPMMRDIDPFCAVTPDNSASKSQDREVGNNEKSVKSAGSAKSTKSFTSQIDNVSDEFAKALAEASTDGTQSEMTHSKDVSETRSADYHDVRTNGTSSKLWQSMLKRGLTSSDVLPSTISSTTARGYLPQFTDQAVLSMSSELSGTVKAPNHGSPSKHNEVNTNGTSTFMVQKATENYPPATAERLSETLLNMVGMKAPAWAN
ncbi:hypothetical protein BD289DRAFT_451720 [Coniella lustricola]|uniref:Uncharacterized protein n=1 Tax=Coniella lustricola TaxID=2025994 RepID=A0A2T3ADV6_9PEZI|nr:hypothetical protein BD289DRAFT_451720 [Coniella lustricola]